MSDLSSTSWSEIDASNNQTPPEGWPAGMAPNAVEPSARMNMGAMKRFWDRVNPTYAAALATTDTFTLSPTVGPGGGNTYGLYERWRARFPSANLTSSPTINISSIGAIFLRKYSGGGAVINPFPGDIQAQDHEFWYDGTQMILENPVGASLGFSPLDQSGAGLSFTNVNCAYNRFGNLIVYYGSFTYPSTADANNASFSLPVNAANKASAVVPAAILSNVASGGPFFLVTAQGSGIVALVNVSNTNQHNSVFSGATIYFRLIYPWV